MCQTPNGTEVNVRCKKMRRPMRKTIDALRTDAITTFVVHTLGKSCERGLCECVIDFYIRLSVSAEIYQWCHHTSLKRVKSLEIGI